MRLQYSSVLNTWIIFGIFFLLCPMVSEAAGTDVFRIVPDSVYEDGYNDYLIQGEDKYNVTSNQEKNWCYWNQDSLSFITQPSDMGVAFEPGWIKWTPRHLAALVNTGEDTLILDTVKVVPLECREFFNIECLYYPSWNNKKYLFPKHTFAAGHVILDRKMIPHAAFIIQYKTFDGYSGILNQKSDPYWPDFGCWSDGDTVAFHLVYTAFKASDSSACFSDTLYYSGIYECSTYTGVSPQGSTPPAPGMQPRQDGHEGMKRYRYFNVLGQELFFHGTGSKDVYTGVIIRKNINSVDHDAMVDK